MRYNKRGLSTVVTTLIIILLVLVAIGIIWVVIRNVIKGGAEDIDFTMKCLEVDVNAVIAKNLSGGAWNITVKRGNKGDDIAGLKLALYDDDAGTNTPLMDWEGNIDLLETKVILMNGTYALATATKVTVTPYFKNQQGDEELCTETYYTI